MDRTGIAVLRVLNKENHKERDNRRARIDDQLPCIRVVEVRARHEPEHDDEERRQESPFRANPVSRLGGKNMKSSFCIVAFLSHAATIGN